MELAAPYLFLPLYLAECTKSSYDHIEARMLAGMHVNSGVTELCTCDKTGGRSRGYWSSPCQGRLLTRCRFRGGSDQSLIYLGTEQPTDDAGDHCRTRVQVVDGQLTIAKTGRRLEEHNYTRPGSRCGRLVARSISFRIRIFPIYTLLYVRLAKF